jgi:drug/metabolite transporter (DMT)-like permease
MPRATWRLARRSVHRRTAHLSPVALGLLWTVGAGITFSVLNALMRGLAQQVDPLQSQFLRYLFGLVVLLPWVWAHGLAAYRPKAIGGQFVRGGLHTVGLLLWFAALPRIPLADTTAIGFTTPLFIMLGAWLFFREAMHWDRWVATAIGFCGVLVVVGPKISLTQSGPGLFHLVMLASAPVFAASFLVTKALTRHETTGTIVLWQAITISVLSLPMAVAVWQPLNAWQWAGFVACGLLGSLAHYCLTQSMAVADISSTQSVKFLDLLWSALLGWAIFAEVPTGSTLLGGLLISAATLWVARRESHRAAR